MMIFYGDGAIVVPIGLIVATVAVVAVLVTGAAACVFVMMRGR
jgi:hypothetical protein